MLHLHLYLQLGKYIILVYNQKNGVKDVAMLSIVKSYGLTGIDGYLVKCEIDINQGLPGYDIVGLVGTAIKESKERVRSAIKNSALKYPIIKVTVNLAPADTKKEGPVYDLPIALGILSATEQVKLDRIKDFIILGELGLDGGVRKINGVLPILISARMDGYDKVIIPKENCNEASFIEGMEIYGVENLKQAVDFLNGDLEIKPTTHSDYEEVKRKKKKAVVYLLLPCLSSQVRVLSLPSMKSEEPLDTYFSQSSA